MRAQFLIAAAHSGAGKTTVTLGLLRAFQRQGLSVQAYKSGPDYIDPIHHRTASGRDSINLDGYMMSPDHIRDLYERYGADADVRITEGVMGLFDGSRKSEGSSASLAILLGLPVILVVNAKAMAYSAAAILYGLKNFDPRLNIAGVIFNFVNTPSHYRLLQEACEDVGVTALGHLPNHPSLRIPSRHLGLDTADAGAAIDAAADHIIQYIDLDVFLRAVQTVDSGRAAEASGRPFTEVIGRQTAEPGQSDRPAPGHPRTILIARDAAFHFLYPENIRRLEQWGHVRYFSPLHDTQLPPADLIYLPGGYPELYLETLSNNISLLNELRQFPGKIIAECGGMMFLGQSITDETGKAWPMTGLLDISTTIEKKKLTLGYRRIELDGHILKGHEFHYSQFVGTPPGTPIFHRPNLLASYSHFYWGEDPTAIFNWLDA